MAMRPMVATNTLLIWPWYFAMAGTRLMAYIGITTQGFDHAEDGGVDHGHTPQGQNEEGDDEQLNLLVVRLFAGGAHLLHHHALQTFTGTQVVTEEGGDDGDEGNQRAEVGDEGARMLVGQVGEHGNVLGLGFCQLGRSQAHHAGEDEEHHEAQQYDGGALQDGVRWARAKLEMAGLWLKENTSTGMVSHRVVAKSLALGTSLRAAPVQSGMR